MAVTGDFSSYNLGDGDTAVKSEQAMEKSATDGEGKKEPTPLEKFWKAVRDNPSDFTGWTYLLQFVEQQNDAEAAREAFDAFLAKYPYCYGYWKKYADLETKNDNMDEAEKVFEKGLKAIPLSVDLWLHFLNFEMKKYENHSDKFSQLRRVFERAITAAGTDFRSDKLWEMYIEWEMIETRNLVNVTTLYDRVIAIPTHLYSHHFDKFTKHVEANNPKDILTLDEFLKLRTEVIRNLEEQKKKSADPAAMDGTDAADEDAAPPGEEAPPGAATDIAKVDEDEMKALRDKILDSRRAVHKRTEEEVSKRWSYEEGIRRPYFHVKPLEKGQLKNWKEYLDFEIENGSHERVTVLFERCMIACALYEDFWLKYAKYMEKHNADMVRMIYRRACDTHLPKKPTIHLEWAAFEERQGNFNGAAEVMDNLEKQVPGLAMVQCRRIGLRRRQGRFKEAQDLYQKCIDEAKDPAVSSYYAIKYARYLSKALGNDEKARLVLEAALEKDTNNHKVLLQLIDVEYGKSNINETAMLTLFDRCLRSDLELEHRVAFSQRKLEFLEDFGSTVARLLEAYDEHQKLLKEVQTAKKKRKEGESEDEPASKKSKKENGTVATTGDSATSNSTQQIQSTASSTHSQHGHQDSQAYNNYYNQWGGHYGGWGNYGQSGWGYGGGGWGQNY